MTQSQLNPPDGPIEVHMWRFWDGCDVLAVSCPVCAAPAGAWCVNALGIVHTPRVFELFAIALDGAA